MIRIETTTEQIESQGGTYLAAQAARKMGLTELKSAVVPGAANIICALFCGLAQGNSGYEPVKGIKGNRFYEEAFGLGMGYSENTVRLYLERLGEEDEEGMREQLNAASYKLLQMAKINGIRVGKKTYLPIDGDTTPMDNSRTKKEGVSWTYKRFAGYQPMLFYAGREGYLLDCELRPGSQHCQKGTPEMIGRLREKARALAGGRRVLYRLDSGNDSIQTIKELIRDDRGNKITGAYFIIKRNLRGKKNEEEWLERAKKSGAGREERKGKTVWTGRAAIHPLGYAEVSCVYEVVERTSDYNNEPLLLPEIEVNAWWTNMRESADAIISLYHDHGTMEQFHSEIKSDMGVERLPSGKLKVNGLYLKIAMNVYNVLRYIGQTAKTMADVIPVKTKSKRMRIGKVLMNIIGIAVKFVRHAGKSIIKIYQDNPWQQLFVRLCTVFQLL